MTNKILIIDSNIEDRERVARHLMENGYNIFLTSFGNKGLMLASNVSIDLIILELNLPDIKGTEVIKCLKDNKRLADIPLVVVSNNNDEIDKFVTFTLGVTDYVTKPVSLRELTLRVKAILKRTVKSDSLMILSNGKIKVDLQSFKGFAFDTPLNLTNIEFKILSLLLKKQNRVLSRDEILQGVWRNSDSANARIVDAHIRLLRKKLGKYKGEVETIQGVGYRMRAHRFSINSDDRNLQDSNLSYVDDEGFVNKFEVSQLS
ncbi:MAG: response regulator transcription factor [Deltaproteobacteria bacterium]|nr:response regulator transcription factor [Deltaproteobacteria bacterium]